MIVNVMLSEIGTEAKYEITHQLERERSIFYRNLIISSCQTRFKIMKLTAIRNGPKQTISSSGGLGVLHKTR